MARFWKFAGLCMAAILGTAGAIAGVLWWLGALAPGELGLHGTIALTLGVTMSAALGVGLMALVFASARGGGDGDAANGSRGIGGAAPGPK